MSVDKPIRENYKFYITHKNINYLTTGSFNLITQMSVMSPRIETLLVLINLIILIYLFVNRHEVHSMNTHTLQNAG